MDGGHAVGMWLTTPVSGQVVVMQKDALICPPDSLVGQYSSPHRGHLKRCSDNPQCFISRIHVSISFMPKNMHLGLRHKNEIWMPSAMLVRYEHSVAVSVRASTGHA